MVKFHLSSVSTCRISRVWTASHHGEVPCRVTSLSLVSSKTQTVPFTPVPPVERRIVSPGRRGGEGIRLPASKETLPSIPDRCARIPVENEAICGRSVRCGRASATRNIKHKKSIKTVILEKVYKTRL